MGYMSSPPIRINMIWNEATQQYQSECGRVTADKYGNIIPAKKVKITEEGGD